MKRPGDSPQGGAKPTTPAFSPDVAYCSLPGGPRPTPSKPPARPPARPWHASAGYTLQTPGTVTSELRGPCGGENAQSLETLYNRPKCRTKTSAAIFSGFARAVTFFELEGRHVAHVHACHSNTVARQSRRDLRPVPFSCSVVGK